MWRGIRDVVTARRRTAPPAEPPGLAWSDVYPVRTPRGLMLPRNPPVRTVAAATSSSVLVPANPGRRSVLVTNAAGGGNLYLALAPVASTAAGGYSTVVAAGGSFALEADPDPYIGAIAGVWDSAIGSAQITETVL